MNVEANWQQLFMVMSLLTSRMLVALSVIPLFVGRSIPMMVRMAFVAALALAILPAVLADPAVLAIKMTNIALYAAKEAAIGLVIGLVSSVGFWAMYAAGVIIEYQAGLSMATTIDPLTSQEDSMIGGLLMQLFSILFLATGGLLALIGMLFDSYTVWPLASLAPQIGSLELAQLIIGTLAQLLGLAIKVAAPFVILLLAVEVAVSYLSRFAPQLNVFFVSLPLKVLLLAAMLLLYCAMISSNFGLLPHNDFTRALDVLRGAFGGR
ncbi:MAG TPA: type III secretion system export apparatus subunit SctT [Povalibacter sp.]